MIAGGYYGLFDIDMRGDVMWMDKLLKLASDLYEMGSKDRRGLPDDNSK